MLHDIVVTLDRWSGYSLSRCVHTINQVELDSQHGVVKIRHYVQIMRRNRQGYESEGIRAHMHNTRKARRFKLSQGEWMNERKAYTRTNKEKADIHTWKTKFQMPLWKETYMRKPERSLIRSHTKRQARFTHKRQSFECLYERRDAWANPDTPLSQDTRTHKQGLHTRDKISYTFVKGEMHGQAWLLPCHKTLETHKQGLHKRDKFSNSFVKGEVHGQARMLSCHKTPEHTSKIYTNTQDTKVWMPLWKERCMGKPETLRCQKTHKHTRASYNNT